MYGKKTGSGTKRQQQQQEIPGGLKGVVCGPGQGLSKSVGGAEGEVLVTSRGGGGVLALGKKNPPCLSHSPHLIVVFDVTHYTGLCK